MEKTKVKDSYPVINVVFVVIILVVFVYSGIFRSGDSYLVPSQHRFITGENTQSIGLSRAFSEMVRLNFKEAKEYNENSWEVFAFFFLQFLLRIIFLFSYNNMDNKKLLIRFDAIGSAMLFLLCFKDIILSMYA